MKSARLVIIAAACSFAATMAMAELAKPYDILARKSIFSRDRTTWTPPGRHITTGPWLPAVPVVTGIVRDDAGYVAIVETPGTGQPVQVRVGDTLPGNRGVVTEINLDCFVFVPPSGGAPRKALVGRNLDGAESTLAPATTQSSEAPIEGDDIIARLRRRRQQEGK